MGILDKEYRSHYKQNLIVAMPVVFGQAGHMIATMADSIMVGHISSVQLAAASVASGVYHIIFVFGIGMAMGLTPLVGTANGERDSTKLSSYLRNGMISNLILALVLSLLMYWASFHFGTIGQKEEIIKYAVPFFLLLAASVVPYMIFMTMKQFADGLEYTKPGMIVSLVANLLNIILNYFLIYGHGGLPRLELYGAGIATLISRTLMPILFFAIFYFSPRLKPYFSEIFNFSYNFDVIKSYIKIGFPSAVQITLETAAFASGTLIIGWIGTQEVAAHQITINVASLTFMMAGGFGAAATIRMSNLIGQKDYIAMRKAGNASYILVWAFMSITAIIFFLFGKNIAGFYVEDQAVINMAAQLFIIAAFFQLVDGTQVVALGTLRGMQDVKIPTYLTMISYWLVTIPMCYYLGISKGYGVQGVWNGYLIGLAFAAIILYSRFHFFSKKMIEVK